MRNHISDLNDYLFEEVERLLDDDLDEKAFAKEVQRAGALAKVADKIIGGASLVLKAEQLKQKGVSAPATILESESPRKLIE